MIHEHHFPLLITERLIDALGHLDIAVTDDSSMPFIASDDADFSQANVQQAIELYKLTRYEQFQIRAITTELTALECCECDESDVRETAEIYRPVGGHVMLLTSHDPAGPGILITQTCNSDNNRLDVVVIQAGKIVRRKAIDVHDDIYRELCRRVQLIPFTQTVNHPYPTKQTYNSEIFFGHAVSHLINLIMEKM